MPPLPAPVMYAPPAGSLSAPVRKRPPWLVVGLVGLIALVLVAGSGVAYFLHQKSGFRSAPSGTGIILSDPLTAKVSGWADDSRCHFGTDGYHVTGGVICLAPVSDLTDGTVQVQAELLQGSTDDAYGISVRWAGRNSGYFFTVSGHGDVVSGRGEWSFVEEVNGTSAYVVRPTVDPAILGGLNHPNLLKVTMHGIQFDFYVNGVHVGSVADTTFASGLVGLASSGNGTASGASDVVFTHLLITTETS